MFYYTTNHLPTDLTKTDSKSSPDLGRGAEGFIRNRIRRNSSKGNPTAKSSANLNKRFTSVLGALGTFTFIKLPRTPTWGLAGAGCNRKGGSRSMGFRGVFDGS